jgi:peptidoglycan/xylan/chitin deacetylase (PgdA/CDA1 family)
MIEENSGMKKDSKALILSYHRVCERNSDPWGLCVTPQHFSEHLDVLGKLTHPHSLHELIAGNTENGSIVVTFDDGYADNLHNAAPLLERKEIPATVFIVSGSVGGREFWWDQVERTFLQPGRLPQELHLKMKGNDYCWNLNETTDYSEEACERNRSWRAWETAPTTRHSVYYSVWEKLHLLDEEEREQCMDQLLSWAGARTDRLEESRTLSIDELMTLSKSKLIEIGSHTVTHPSLPKLPATEQKSEIAESKNRIETIIGKPLSSFAYPHGDYTAETAFLVQQCGFRCACSTAASVVTEDISTYELPRFQVHDWDGEQFARQLSVWFGRT